MKLFPEAAHLKQSRTFAWVFYGEVAVLASSLFGLTFAWPPELKVGFFVIASIVFSLHTFLIWAWGRRYPLIDWIYVAWNIATLAILLQIMIGAQLTMRPPSSASIGLYIGRPSTFIAVSVLVLAVVIRSVGVFWSAFIPKADMRREESRWPALYLSFVLVGMLIALGTFIVRAPQPQLDLAILLYFLGGGMDAVRVFL